MDEVSQIRDKIDIVPFIADYVSLKKAGSNFKAKCPFHNEKTPSFVISPERQIWHCFGCGKGGDIFTFLMEYESMEFPEALRTLAKKAGVQLRESSFSKNQSFEKEKIFEINAICLKFYNFLLTKHAAGKKALDYLLKKRGLTLKLIETFALGFSPAGSSLSNYLTTKKNYKPMELIKAGISFDRNGKTVDFFKDRIIFPLFDHRGNVSGFSARALNEVDMPKYINTKETPVYHKGSMFFGLNLSKDEIKKKQDAIIVEGEFDVISFFSQGFKNVVAIKGTALTEDQVALLSRFTPKVTLCLDQDEAGFEATKRGLSILEKRGMSINIIDMGNFKDPDEAFKKDPIAFRKKINQSINIYDYLLSFYTQKYPPTSMEGKKKITDEILPIFSQISNEIIKEHYIKKLSKNIDISAESIVKEVEKFQKAAQESKIILPKVKKSRRELLEEYLIALIIQNPSLKEILEEEEEKLLQYKFEITSFEKILAALNNYFSKNKNFDSKLFANTLPSELVNSFNLCFLYPLPKFDSELKIRNEIKKVLTDLLQIFAKIRLSEISEEIRRKQGEGQENKIEILRKEYKELLALLKQN